MTKLEKAPQGAFSSTIFLARLYEKR